MSKSVLLIEDEPNIIEAIGFILQRDGWKVATHTDGATATQAIHDASPDVVILDVMLPNRSGYDILKDIRADTETADLPVMMLTARGQTKDREMAQEAGASCFMTKPFSNADVIETLHKLTGR